MRRGSATSALVAFVISSCAAARHGHIRSAIDSEGNANVSRRLQAKFEDAPVPTVVLGAFEADADGWTTQCAGAGSGWVAANAPGVPPSRTPGSEGMYRFNAGPGPECFKDSSLDFIVPAATLVTGVAYHLTAWIWVPQFYCTTDANSLNCPYTKFAADMNEDGAGTMLTATAGQWNAISGTVITMTGTDITVMVKQLPVGIDVYIDDVTLTNCSLANFRKYAQPRLEALHKRDVTLTIGPAPAAAGDAPGVMTLEQVRHAFPFGATVTADELALHPNMAEFFVNTFNAVTDEYNQKWEFQEPQQDVYEWEKGDAVYKFAVDNDLMHRGHNIFAEGGHPVWLTDLPNDGSANSIQAAVWKRLNEYLDRYDPQTVNYDVVNELTHFKLMSNMLTCLPSGVGCMCTYAPACAGMDLAPLTPWWNWAWAATRFLLTQRGSGKKRLFQNDYCTAHYCGPHNAPSNMVKLTQRVGNDVYGMQMHQGEAWETCGFDTHLRVQETTNAAPGSGWWFTEFDVDEPDLIKRADGYEMAYLAAYSHPRVEGMILWGWGKETIAPTQDGRPNTALITDFDTLAFNAAGERIFGANGVLTQQFKSNIQAPVPAAGVTSPLLLFKGTYQLTLGGCTTNFQVMDDSPVDVAQPLKWVCPAGVAPSTRTISIEVGCDVNVEGACDPVVPETPKPVVSTPGATNTPVDAEVPVPDVVTDETPPVTDPSAPPADPNADPNGGAGEASAAPAHFTSALAAAMVAVGGALAAGL